MAAVLLALAEAAEDTRMDWQTALGQMPVERLRELLRSLTEGDGSLQDRIVRMVPGRGDDPAQWQADLDQITSKYADGLLMTRPATVWRISWSISGRTCRKAMEQVLHQADTRQERKLFYLLLSETENVLRSV